MRFSMIYKGQVAFRARRFLHMPNWAGEFTPIMIPVRVEIDGGRRAWNPTRMKKRPMNGYGGI